MIGVAFLIIFRHLPNIRRLMKYQEPKIGEKKPDGGGGVES
jgi:glycerol-3-phosphate acyltransferase PlsY